MGRPMLEVRGIHAGYGALSVLRGIDMHGDSACGAERRQGRDVLHHATGDVVSTASLEFMEVHVTLS